MGEIFSFFGIVFAGVLAMLAGMAWLFHLRPGIVLMIAGSVIAIASCLLWLRHLGRHASGNSVSAVDADALVVLFSQVMTAFGVALLLVGIGLWLWQRRVC